jgi:hypothetical protein
VWGTPSLPSRTMAFRGQWLSGIETGSDPCCLAVRSGGEHLLERQHGHERVTR